MGLSRRYTVVFKDAFGNQHVDKFAAANCKVLSNGAALFFDFEENILAAFSSWTEIHSVSY